MTLREFIKTYKTELSAMINRAVGNNESDRVSNHEIELWVRNDEGLYLWAKDEGVRL